MTMIARFGQSLSPLLCNRCAAAIVLPQPDTPQHTHVFPGIACAQCLTDMLAVSLATSVVLSISTLTIALFFAASLSLSTSQYHRAASTDDEARQSIAACFLFWRWRWRMLILAAFLFYAAHALVRGTGNLKKRKRKKRKRKRKGEGKRFQEFGWMEMGSWGLFIAAIMVNGQSIHSTLRKKFNIIANTYNNIVDL